MGYAIKETELVAIHRTKWWHLERNCKVDGVGRY